MPSGAFTASGCAIWASVSTPSTNRGPGRTKAASASTAHTGTPSGYDPTLDHLLGQLASPVESVATRRDHDHIGSGRFNRGPLDLLRSLTGDTKDGFRTRRRDHVGHPVAGGKRGVGPLEHRQSWARPSGDRRRDLPESALQFMHQGGRRLRCVGGPTHRADRRQNLGQGHRIERDHRGPTPQVVERLVDLGYIDRAHRAEILGHDEIRVDGAQRIGVERVEILPGGQAGPNLGVDLRWGETAWQAGV